MLLRLAPHSPLIWRSPSTVQVGYGESAIVFDRVASLDESLLLALERSATLAHLHALCRTERRDESQADELLSDLGRAHHLVSVDQIGADHVGVDEEGRLSGTRRGDMRARATIAIDGLEACGVALALGLLEAGIGRVMLIDEQPVRARDLGLAGYARDRLGVARQEALATWINGTIGAKAVVDDFRIAPTCAIVIANFAAHSLRYRRWMHADTPHAVVTFEPDRVDLGPFVVPGRSRCYGCRDLERSRAEPSWPIQLAQLSALQTSLQDAPRALAAAARLIEVVVQQVDRGDAGFGDAGRSITSAESATPSISTTTTAAAPAAAAAPSISTSTTTAPASAPGAWENGAMTCGCAGVAAQTAT